jgi:Flp pilus assembly protein TadG
VSPQSIARRRASSAAGQSLTEFALILPVFLLIVLAVADFGRLFNSMVAVEAAAREAADYGSFKSVYWDAAVGNPPVTTAEMRRRACTAASGSHLDDYSEPAGTVNHSDCDNPTMQCRIEPSSGPDEDCAMYSGTACSDSTTDPPCTIHVTLTYTFRPILDVSILGWSTPTVTFSRQSLFRISDLPTP